MHSLFFFFLLFISAEGVAGVSIGEPDLRYLCSNVNSSLCVGVSFPDADYPNLFGYYLQLKHRFSLIVRKEYENAQKHIAWSLKSDQTLRPFFDSRVSVSMNRQGRLKTVELGLKGSNITLNYTTKSTFMVRMPESNCCLTIMQCDSGPSDYCNPLSVKGVVKPGQLRWGTYIGCKPCMGVTNYTLSQVFTTNHDCRVGCKDWMLGNKHCDSECLNTECFNDLHDCEPGGSRSPTLQPTPLPTTQATYIDANTSNPTRGPTREPTRGPTSSLTVLATEQPTRSPTRLPTTDGPTTSRPTTQQPTTQQPTTQQPTTGKPTDRPTSTDKPTTQEPTFKRKTEKPTRQPTLFPTEKPTRQPTLFPTDKPTKQPVRKPSRSHLSVETKAPTPNTESFIITRSELDELNKNITALVSGYATSIQNTGVATLSITSVCFILFVLAIMIVLVNACSPLNDPLVPPRTKWCFGLC